MEEAEAMNEFMQIIIFAVIVGGSVFGATWMLIQDMKKGAHARISRLENVIDEIVRDCGKKKDQYITTGAFDRFDTNVSNRLNAMQGQMNSLNSRIDDLVLALRNGGVK